MVLQEEVSADRVLPGAAVVARIRRIFVVALIAALGYASLSAGTKGSCAGGFDNAGGFTDAAGNAVNEVPLCITISMQPSPLVFLAIALIVFFALGRVLKAPAEAAALRTLDRAAVAIGVPTVCAVVISMTWFALIPITEIDPRSFQIFAPFPFGAFDVAVTPMQVSPGAP